MAKYFIQDETLTNLADKIRVLNGTEDTMTPAVMNSELASANDEVDAQSALIDQLSAALDGKAGGGSDSGSRTVSVTIEGSTGFQGLPIYYFNTNGQIIEVIDTETVDALGGIVFAYGNHSSAILAEGEYYEDYTNGGATTITFLSDGGRAYIAIGGGGAGGE